MNVLITLGPTREHIDSVRYITSASSGKMGAALAKEALKRGHKVTIVAGPVSIELPDSANVLRVSSAAEMTDCSLKELAKGFDMLISTAAVADYTPANKADGKIKSGTAGLKIELAPTRKLTQEARKKHPKLFIVAFKAEHSVPREELENCALRKLSCEKLDLIAANDIGENAFGSNATQITLMDKTGVIAKTGKITKEKIAKRMWDVIEKKKE